MKKRRLFALVLALTLSVLTLCGCAQQPEIERLEAPAQEDFTLSVELQDDTVTSGESFVLECSLENHSGNNYHIHHFPEIITYSYNDDSEYREALGDVSDFLDGEEITRTIEIPAAESGTITVTADFDVELNTGTLPYVYSQEFEVTVE